MSGYLSDPEVFPSNFQNIHFYNVQSLIEKIRANSHFYNKVTPATMLPSLRNGTTIKCRPIHVYCLPSQLIFDPRSLSPVPTSTCKFKIYNLLPNSGWHKKPEPSISKKSVGGSFSHLCLVFSYASNHSELINLGLGKAVHSHNNLI